MKKKHAEIARVGKARRFTYDVGDVLLMEHLRSFIDGWTFILEGQRVVSVYAKLRRAERNELVKELMTAPAKEVDASAWRKLIEEGRNA